MTKYGSFYYLYLRTRTSLQNANDILSELFCVLPRDSHTLSLEKGNYTWDNGLVVRLRTTSPFDDLLSSLLPSFERFDAWALHDANRKAADSSGIDAFIPHLRETWIEDGPHGGPAAQIFLQFDTKSSSPECVSRSIRLEIGEDSCHPSMHFEDGRILIVPTIQPVATIFRRIERQLSGASRWVICDCDGNTRDRHGLNSPVWSWVNPDDAPYYE